MFGILNINKPAGMTSRRVVDRVAKLVRPAKAGHAGTLDPSATGVLVVCVGPATRLIELIQKQPKQYLAHFLLGKRSDTDDLDGVVVDVPLVQEVARAEVEALLPEFVGSIEQVPPQFSAVHVQGRRAYSLARGGQSVELRARPVDVHQIRLTGIEFPELELEIVCGSGTYIRSIARDLGERLGCGALMSRLVRTAVGPYALNSAIDFDRLTADSLSDVLLPPTSALADCPVYHCTDSQLSDIRCGRAFGIKDSIFDDAATVAVIAPSGMLVCLARFRSDDGTLAPKPVFIAGA
ncbi:MAG: tRNA pseudouridine(55) synthase TruB [Planctomycetaceae bacterium]